MVLPTPSSRRSGSLDVMDALEHNKSTRASLAQPSTPEPQQRHTSSSPSALAEQQTPPAQETSCIAGNHVSDTHRTPSSVNSTSAKSRPASAHESPPSNKGAASSTPYSSTTNLSEASPWIAHDLKNAQTCEFLDLLKMWLVEVSKSHTEDDHVSEKGDKVLTAIIQAVLPICDDNKVKGPLGEYCRTIGDKKKRYPPLIAFLNSVLEKLEGVDVPGFRKPDGRPMFLRNDPTIATGSRHGSLRGPEISFVSRESAERFYGVTNERWEDIAFKRAPRTRAKSFGESAHALNWTEPKNRVYTHIEVKKTGNITTRPLENYDIEPPGSVPVLWTPSNSEGLPEMHNTDAPMTGGSTAKTSHKSRQTSARSAPRSSLTRCSEPNSPNALYSEKKTSTGAIQRTSNSDGPRKRQAQEEKGTDKAEVHAGLYAAEMLSAGFAAHFAIMLVITDDQVQIWRYDRQGCIQSTGLNFVRDLPYFVALLFTFQRFSLPQWGYMSEFQPRNGCFHLELEAAALTQNAKLPDDSRAFTNAEKHKVILSLSHQADAKHFGILGRATNMIRAKSTSDDPSRPGHSLSERSEMMCKLAWIANSRVPEITMLAEAVRVARENGVAQNVPEPILYAAFPHYDTANVRKRLRIADDSAVTNRRTPDARTLWLIVFPVYEPITNLTGRRFLKAFKECFVCHYKLWQGGVRHRDISVGNLMVQYVDGHPVGVLIDFDLATRAEMAGPSSRERTGTVPYMALDLLELGSKTDHIYRFDAESFFWVAFVITSTYENGKQVHMNGHPLKTVLVGDYDAVRIKKVDILFAGRTTPRPTASYQNVWRAVRALMLYFHRLLSSRPPEDPFDYSENSDASEDSEELEESEDSGEPEELGDLEEWEEPHKWEEPDADVVFRALKEKIDHVLKNH